MYIMAICMTIATNRTHENSHSRTEACVKEENMTTKKKSNINTEQLIHLNPSDDVIFCSLYCNVLNRREKKHTTHVKVTSFPFSIQNNNNSYRQITNEQQQQFIVLCI